jgi:tetratricopeptide (TPR) repeat protein
MREWVDRIFIANPDRTNFGEREKWKGEVEFELGNFDVAKEFLTIAYKKSGGREFSEEDKKYVDFIFGREPKKSESKLPESKTKLSETKSQESKTELPESKITEPETKSQKSKTELSESKKSESKLPESKKSKTKLQESKITEPETESQESKITELQKESQKGQEPEKESQKPETKSQKPEIESEITELPDKIYNKLTSLSEKGDSLAEKGKYDKAIETYNTALELIPLPRENWDAATWLYAAVGDAYFLKKDWENALNCFMDAQKCPDGLGNPFLCLRIGQCFYETGNFKNAESYLLQAYMLDGKDIFENDECEAKYFEAIKSLI